MKDMRAVMEIGDDLLDKVAGGRTDDSYQRRNGSRKSAGTEGSAGGANTQEYDCPVCGCKHPFVVVSGSRGIGVGCDTQIEV